MVELLHADGFLGTAANFAADMTLILCLLVALIFTTGAWLARRRQYEIHRWVQTSGALLNVILVLWLMVLPYRDFVIRDLAAPRPRPDFFYWVTTIHAGIGLLAFVFGNFVMLRGNNLMITRLKFNNYKPYMRIAYILYMTATLLGILVYLSWFVFIPNPPLYE